jgi:hypothetical protein
MKRMPFHVCAKGMNSNEDAHAHSLVEKILADLNLSDGDHELIRNVSGFKYPIKIVVSVESAVMTVITNYPLKKGRSQ